MPKRDRFWTRSRFDWTQLAARRNVDLQVAQRSLQITSTLKAGKLQTYAQSALLALNPLGTKNE